MSMPQLHNKDRIPSLEQSLSAIVSSIAMEETALSKLITAESDKIQYVLDCAKIRGCDCASLKDILAVNNSATCMIKTITELQMILKEKLAIASKHLKVSPCPPHPPLPPCPPYPPCISVFETETDYTWCKNKTLFLLERNRCHNGVKHIRKNCQSLITLPRGKEIELQLEFEAINKKSCPALINMEFYINGNIVKLISLPQKNMGNDVKIVHDVCYKTPKDSNENAVSFKLISPDSLCHVNAQVSVKVK